MTYDKKGIVREEEVQEVTFEEILRNELGKELPKKKEEKKRTAKTPNIPSGYENTIDGYRIIHQMNCVCDMRIFKN